MSVCLPDSLARSNNRTCIYTFSSDAILFTYCWERRCLKYENENALRFNKSVSHQSIPFGILSGSVCNVRLPDNWSKSNVALERSAALLDHEHIHTRYSLQ
jgi:hypothetical protein